MVSSIIHNIHFLILLSIDFRIEVGFLVRPFSASHTLANQENNAERISEALHFLPPPEARAFFTGHDAGSLRSALFSIARVATLIAR